MSITYCTYVVVRVLCLTKENILGKVIFTSCLSYINGAETNCRIARNLSILLMNHSHCFSVYIQHHSSYVCSDV